MATIDDIVQTAMTVFRDYQTPGVPSTKAWEPPKAEVRALFVTLASILQDIIDRGFQGDDVKVTTWAELAAIPPVRAGQLGVVQNDAGTHSQAGTGETDVPNQGSYSGTSGGLWKRVGDYVALTTTKVANLDTLIANLINVTGLANAAEVVAGLNAAKVVSPATLKALNDALGIKPEEGGATYDRDALGFVVSGYDPVLGLITPRGFSRPSADFYEAEMDPLGFVRAALAPGGKSYGYGGTEQATESEAEAVVVEQVWYDANDTQAAFKWELAGGATAATQSFVQFSRDSYFTEVFHESGNVPPVKIDKGLSFYLNCSYTTPKNTLEPLSTCYARIVADGVPGPTITVKTAPPLWGPGADVEATISCENPPSLEPTPIPIRDALVLDPTIRSLDQIGDRSYPDFKENNPPAMRAWWRSFGRNPSVVASKAVLPEVHDPDDHERDNDINWDTAVSGSTAPELDASVRKTLRELQPTLAPWVQRTVQGNVDPAQLCWTRVRDRGRRRVIRLDTHTQRRKAFAGAPGTILGHTSGHEYWDHLGWLIDTALPQAVTDYAAGRINLLEIISTTGFGTNYDGWYDNADWVAEWRMICNAILGLPGLPQIVVRAGDFHRGAADSSKALDKSTAQCLTVPMIMTSPGLRTSILTGSGPYTWQGAQKHIDVKQQYLRGAYDGNGGWAFKWFGEPFTDGAPTELASVASTDGQRRLAFTAATYTGAAGSTIQVPIKKVWVSARTEYAFGNAQADFATSAGASGVAKMAPNSGLLTIGVTVPATGSTTVTLSNAVGCTLAGGQATCTVSPAA